MNEVPEEGCGTITMPPRDMLAMTAPVTLEQAVFAAGFPSMDDLREESRRVAIWATMAVLRYEYADAMLAARKDGPQ